jgi:hypothetical protein
MSLNSGILKLTLPDSILLTFIVLVYCMWHGHLNLQVTKVPYVVCCSHLNALYTHVEAQNYSPTH